ncbi:TPA: hypothetical protein F8R96_07420 [Legionella pneumophila]|nr:hypothetical protein [Legionella pneumophila]HAU1320765.1 hypothetical protein [Legionella pneumophila]
MKLKHRVIHYLILCSMVLLMVKPAVFHNNNQQAQSNAQYIHSITECPQRTALMNSCLSNVYYIIADEEFPLNNVLSLLTFILYFLVIQSNYKSPVSSIFKPPIPH